MGRALALGGELDDFTASLKDTFTTPGSQWQYVSIDTHVIGMVIRGATGRSIPDLLSEKIITPLGLEQAPYYVTDGDGVAFVLGGLNITTRDYARFGQMILQDCEWQGEQIIPADWIAESTAPSTSSPVASTSSNVIRAASRASIMFDLSRCTPARSAGISNNVSPAWVRAKTNSRSANPPSTTNCFDPDRQKPLPTARASKRVESGANLTLSSMAKA